MRSNKINRNNLFVIIYAVAIILTAIMSAVFVIVFFELKSDKTTSKTYDKYYVLITDDYDSSFWQSVYDGASAYGEDNNVFIENLAENLSNNYSSEELMRIAIASHVDGIMVNASDAVEMRMLIDEAVSEGIPVVTIYNDSPLSERLSFVSVGNYNMGREYGREALELARIKLTEMSEVNIAVLVDSVSDSGQSITFSGITEAIDNEFDGDGAINVYMTQVDNTNAFAVEESIRDVFLAETIPDIIICLNEKETTCVYQGVVDFNKVGQVSIIGYYDSETIINAIERNIVDSTISVNTTQLGQYAVEALIDYERTGYTNQFYSVDINLIDSKTVKSYQVREEEYD